MEKTEQKWEMQMTQKPQTKFTINLEHMKLEKTGAMMILTVHVSAKLMIGGNVTSM